MSNEEGEFQAVQTLLALRLSDEPELAEGTTFPLKMSCASISTLDHQKNMRSSLVQELVTALMATNLALFLKFFLVC
jgi:hypothetical protein